MIVISSIFNIFHTINTFTDIYNVAARLNQHICNIFNNLLQHLVDKTMLAFNNRSSLFLNVQWIKTSHVAKYCLSEHLNKMKVMINMDDPTDVFMDIVDVQIL